MSLDAIGKSADGTTLRCRGRGPRVLVVHGGPGFDHRYLVGPLTALESGATLIYFDQLGTGETPKGSAPLSLARLGAQARAVAAAVAEEGRLRVIAHSFGVAVLLEALRGAPELSVRGLLVSPVPTNATRFEAMRQALFARMPEALLAGLAHLPPAKLAKEQIAAMLPFYLAPGSHPDLDALTFDFGIYSEVYNSLRHFDHSQVASRLRHCDLVVGAADFISKAMISDLVRACRSFTVLAGCGHFPFAERPDLFAPWAAEALAT